MPIAAEFKAGKESRPETVGLAAGTVQRFIIPQANGHELFLRYQAPAAVPAQAFRLVTLSPLVFPLDFHLRFCRQSRWPVRAAARLSQAERIREATLLEVLSTTMRSAR